MDPLQQATGRYQGPRVHPGARTWGSFYRSTEAAEVGQPRGRRYGKRRGLRAQLGKTIHSRAGRERGIWEMRTAGQGKARKGDHEGTQERREIWTL